MDTDPSPDLRDLLLSDEIYLSTEPPYITAIDAGSNDVNVDSYGNTLNTNGIVCGNTNCIGHNITIIGGTATCSDCKMEYMSAEDTHCCCIIYNTDEYHLDTEIYQLNDMDYGNADIGPLLFSDVLEITI